MDKVTLYFRITLISHYSRSWTNTPIEHFHSEKNTIFFLNPEPSIWFIMVLDNPKIVAPQQSTILPFSYGKDKEQEERYDEKRWDVKCMLSLLQTIYKILRVSY